MNLQRFIGAQSLQGPAVAAGALHLDQLRTLLSPEAFQMAHVIALEIGTGCPARQLQLQLPPHWSQAQRHLNAMALRLAQIQGVMGLAHQGTQQFNNTAPGQSAAASRA